MDAAMGDTSEGCEDVPDNQALNASGESHSEGDSSSPSSSSNSGSSSDSETETKPNTARSPKDDVGQSGLASESLRKRNLQLQELLRKQLTAFYELHAPEGVSKVESLIEKFLDTQDVLNEKLRAKYGKDLTDIVCTVGTTGGEQVHAQPMEASPGSRTVAPKPEEAEADTQLVDMAAKNGTEGAAHAHASGDSAMTDVVDEPHVEDGGSATSNPTASAAGIDVGVTLPAPVAGAAIEHAPPPAPAREWTGGRGEIYILPVELAQRTSQLPPGFVWDVVSPPSAQPPPSDHLHKTKKTSSASSETHATPHIRLIAPSPDGSGARSSVPPVDSTELPLQLAARKRQLMVVQLQVQPAGHDVPAATPHNPTRARKAYPHARTQSHTHTHCKRASWPRHRVAYLPGAGAAQAAVPRHSGRASR